MKAVITGANRGIGLRILRCFASKGWDVIALVRNLNEAVLSSFQAIADEYHVTIDAQQADLSDENAVKEFARYLHKNKITVDALINNAGTAVGGTMLMSSLPVMKDVFQINFFSPFLLTQYVVKGMLARKKGAVVNVCSIAALDGMNGFTTYGCSKAALAQATRIWASELGPLGIRVNAVAPAAVNTEMAFQMDEKTREQMVGRSFLQRMAEPEEVAAVVYFLASEESAPVNGQIIRIDGGM